MEGMTTFFPAEFTAIAQWIACSIHILSDEKRIRGWKSVALILSALPVMLALNFSHVGQPNHIWLLITACCLLAMMIYLRLGMKDDMKSVILRWCHALMQSEFIAAFAWLINVYLISQQVVHFRDIFASQVIMLVAYAIVFIPLGAFVYNSARRKDSSLKLSYSQVIFNFIIAVGAYTLSNVSFIAPNSIFGTSMGGGVSLVRTVSDFSGMMALMAIEEFSYALQLNANVSVLQNLLDRQYEQYQQFKANNEQMQQVYHDIKHLIHYIRSISSSQKYEKVLQELEETVSTYEAQYDTGNAVLDVMLANKKMMCRSAQITMECFVDAREMGFMDNVHICSIFGNALDNAIEYERQIDEIEKRLIKVNVFAENHFLMIHISNYCEQTILKSPKDPETTKKNPEMHGFGIKGIRLAVEKYSGHMNIKQENKWFIMSILIPIPSD